ncbi:MAG: D-alanyl-D-alanine carboxypeptidase [Bacteriovorax sp.]|nr:D-alanyl-D-alanine carboxypeptidase [Bacteriovorax sp.]
MKNLGLFNILVHISILGLLSTNVLANDQTDKVWSQQLKAEGIDAKDQAYCYTDKDGKATGQNLGMKIRLASVSKLLTSLWAIDKLGVDYKYNTKLYISNNNLHIEGSYDPFLGNEKMFFLLSQLNELGFTKFDTITFDKNVIINPDVQYASDEYPTINSITMSKFLKKYFNTQAWSKDSKDEYSNFYSMAKVGKFRKEVNFEVQNVKMVEANPLANNADVKVLTLSSPSLYKYLKQMNIKSNNYVAETVFRQNGGTQEFSKFLTETFKLSADQVSFYSGSGLPVMINGIRNDNFATCSITLNLISELKKSIEKQGKTIEDVVAVPGSDGGTFRNRIISADFKNSFVAKTGTLMHTSTLAGAMNTQNGFSFFGIFNQSTDISGSKIVQNLMVKSIMNEMGGPKVFNYEVEGFHAYNEESVKSFDEISDFSTIGANLF